MSQPFYYKKNSKGEPIPGSNLKATKKPSSAHVQISNIVIGPIQDDLKPRFSTGNRFFIQFDSNGQPIKGSLIKSSTVPEGFYLEVFKNNTVGLPHNGSNTNSGVIEDTLEDLTSIETLMSADYATGGYLSRSTADRKGKPDRIYPTVSITSPTVGTVIPPNTQFTVTVNASDNVGVQRVSIFVNYPKYGVLIPSDGIELYAPPYTATFTTPDTDCGVVIGACAWDCCQGTQKTIRVECHA